MKHQIRQKLWVALLGLSMLTMVVVGCSETPITPMGTAFQLGDLSITVTGYESRYLDLQADTGAVVVSDDPVLLIFLEATNTAAETVQYDMRDSATSSTQGMTPLLFIDPGEDELPGPTHHVATIGLGRNRFIDDPITSSHAIPPGATISDVLLFELPPESASSLLLSFPPVLFGPEVETAAFFRIAYQPTEPVRPYVGALAEQIEMSGGFTFRLDRAGIDYLPNSDRSAFSQRPVLALHFTVSNTSEAAITYDPPHNARGETAPALFDGERFYDRVTLPEGNTFFGQRFVDEVIPPGGSLSDFVVFDRPVPTVGELTLTFPGHVVSCDGLVRVRFAYVYDDPALPEELQAPQPTPTPVQPTDIDGAEGEEGAEQE